MAEGKHKAAGRQMAEALIAWSEIMYNRDTQRRILTACRNRLAAYIKAIPPSSRGKR